MGIEDLYIISAILGIAVLSILARVLFRNSRAAVSADDTGSSISTLTLAEAGEEELPSLETAANLTVSFSESGKQFPWDPAKRCLLDFIQSKGIEVDCMCGAGECGSCRTRILAGEVTYLKTPKINPGKGFCLLCVTVPKSNLVLAR